MYNSQITGLCKDHWDVQKAIDEKKPPAEIVHVFKNAMELMNDYAVLYGYIGGVLCLFVSLAIAILAESFGLTWHKALVLVMVIMGVWWIIFGLPLFLCVRERENPPLPNAENPLSYIVFSWERTYESFCNVSLMPHTFRFMIAFFVCEFTLVWCGDRRAVFSCVLLPASFRNTDPKPHIAML